jgi:hypothetical protein
MKAGFVQILSPPFATNRRFFPSPHWEGFGIL